MLLTANHLPRGSEYPNSKVLSPKIHTLSGFWTLKPQYLGTWTLRASPETHLGPCHLLVATGFFSRPILPKPFAQDLQPVCIGCHAVGHAGVVDGFRVLGFRVLGFLV